MIYSKIKLLFIMTLGLCLIAVFTLNAKKNGWSYSGKMQFLLTLLYAFIYRIVLEKGKNNSIKSYITKGKIKYLSWLFILLLYLYNPSIYIFSYRIGIVATLIVMLCSQVSYIHYKKVDETNEQKRKALTDQ